MFSQKSKVFVSSDDGFNGEYPVNVIESVIEDKERIYAMSYHSEFMRVDYTEIDRVEKHPGITSVMELTFINNYDITYTLHVDKDQRIFTLIRGFLPALKINEKDIFIDIAGKFCKLVNKRNIPFSDVLCNIGVKYNHSLFCNGILIRSA